VLCWQLSESEFVHYPVPIETDAFQLAGRGPCVPTFNFVFVRSRKEADDVNRAR
jgi:hypothetical protein